MKRNRHKTDEIIETAVRQLLRAVKARMIEREGRIDVVAFKKAGISEEALARL